MSKIDPDEAISQAFEAFCVLSDVQELVGRQHPAYDHVNHAKLHLMRIIGDGEETVKALYSKGIPFACSLEGL